MSTQLNKVELIGTVGRIRVLTIDGTKLAKLTLATNYAYRDKNGTPVIETTWHQITVWEGRNMPNFNEIEIGKSLKVLGRIKVQRYTDQNGNDKTVTEIVASSIDILENTDGPQKD